MQNLYIVGFDINSEKSSTDYSKARASVVELLERWGAKNLQYSVWLVDSALSLQAITDSLTALLDNNDTILVAPTTSNLKLEKGKKLDWSGLLVRRRPRPTLTNEKTSNEPLLPPMPRIKPR